MTDPDAVALAHQLFDLARDGSDRLLGYLDAGAPIELTDASGNTLLMLAAYHGHAPLTRELAARGADPNQLNDRGQSPLAERSSRVTPRWSACCWTLARIRTWAAHRPGSQRSSSIGRSCWHFSLRRDKAAFTGHSINGEQPGRI